TGENVTVLRKLTEQGKLGTDVIKKLMEEMGSRAIGAAADNMELYSGLLSNLIDRWTLFKKAIADAGWSTYVRQLMKDFSEQWDKMVEDGRLAKFAKTISDGFISMAEAVRASLSSICHHRCNKSSKHQFNLTSRLTLFWPIVFLLVSSREQRHDQSR
ncbi:hypothetical protein, partial [Endozoicomonas atrinae]|uniref:hypothetical protein n=1 Tax=Endozoicomonas atrinae TaxID=1333660 RepID=UPI0019310D9B